MDQFANLSAQFPVYRQEGTPDTPFGGFLLYVAVSLTVTLFNLYIDIRQHRRYSDTEVNPLLLELVDKLPPIEQKKKSVTTTDADENGDEITDDQDSPTDAAESTATQDDDKSESDNLPSSENGAKASTEEEEEKEPEEQYTTYKEKILAKFPASQAYSKDKSCFGFVTSAFGIVQGLAFLCLGFAPYMWDQAGEIMNLLPESYASDTVQACIFISITSLLELPLSLPFSIYRTFVLEARHGFNKTTAKTFVKDLCLGLVLKAAIGLPVMAFILSVIEKTGEYFFIYVTVAVMAITFFMMTIYPDFIAPCYNKFDALPDGDLKQKIEDLAAGESFPLKKLFTIDGSKRSAHSNAYLYGFCNNKRIVLFDTLLAQCNEHEIVAILGHEIGHWKMGHTVQNLVISQVQIFLIFYSLSFFLGNEVMYHTFGFNDTPTFIGLTLFLDIAFTPLNPLIQFGMSYMTRKFEFQADAYAAKLGHTAHLKVGLVKLQLENLGALAVDPLYSAYHYSHPPIVERLRALDEFEKKAD